MVSEYGGNRAPFRKVGRDVGLAIESVSSLLLVIESCWGFAADQVWLWSDEALPPLLMHRLAILSRYLGKSTHRLVQTRVDIYDAIEP